MLVKDIMTKKVISVSPDEKVTEVADIIFKNKFHALPVAKDGKLVGIITEDDFFLKGYNDLYLPSYIQFLKSNKVVDSLPRNIRNKIEKLLGAEAKDLMSSPCMNVSPNTPVPKLMNLIKKTKFTTWPVTDLKNNLIGIVTLVDILGFFRGGGHEMEKAYKDHINKTREVDLIAKDVQSFWRKTFVFIKKTRVRTWKGVFLIAFISGAIAALIWTVSVRIQTKSGAQVKSAVLTLKAGSAKINVGDPINIDVLLDTQGGKINYVNVAVKYDPQEFKLEIWDSSGSAFHQDPGCLYMGKPCEIIENKPEKGEIDIKMASPKEGVTNSQGKIVNVVFRALKPVSADAPNIIIDPVSSAVYEPSTDLFGYDRPTNVLSEINNAKVEAGNTKCAEGLYCTGISN